MGSLRDLKRGDSPSGVSSETSRLYSRLQELVIEYGNAWKKISEVIEAEGFREKDEVFTPNALRKRYMRWKESERAARLPVSSTPPVSTESLPPHSPILGVEELIALNKQLLGQVRESNKMMQRLERRLEDQELKSNHTGVDAEPPVTTRDLLEFIKEFSAGRPQMQFIEEERKDSPSREEVQQIIGGIVEEKVESELKAMLAEGGSFARELTRLVDQRLKTIFSGGEPVVQTAHPGPGRGKKGKTHKKFSASLEESLFERVKALRGQFSGHLSNALEAYLSVVEEKAEE